MLVAEPSLLSRLLYFFTLDNNVWHQKFVTQKKFVKGDTASEFGLLEKVHFGFDILECTEFPVIKLCHVKALIVPPISTTSINIESETTKWQL